jgi:peptide maturation system protein (TIGR04066 family)
MKDMEKSKTIVYPFDMEFSPLLRHPGLLPDLDFNAVVSPAGWGLAGHDAAAADGGPRTGIKVTSDFESALEGCDTVLFSTCEHGLDAGRFLHPKMILAARAGKRILCTAGAEGWEIPQAVSAGIVRWDRSEPAEVAVDPAGGIRDISTPVITIIGLGERANKFEIQLSLREHLLALGYRVSQIGSRNYCGLLGFHSFPAFMFSPALSEEAKITAFNAHVREIEREEKPDVIVIGVPGGIMPYNNRFTNRFGMTALEVSAAVTADACVVAVFFEDVKPDYFRNMAEAISYRFGYEVDVFAVANRMLDMAGSEQAGRICHLGLESGFVDNEIGRYSGWGKPVMNVLGPGGGKKLADHLVNVLQELGETVNV